MQLRSEKIGLRTSSSAETCQASTALVAIAERDARPSLMWSSAAGRSRTTETGYLATFLDDTTSGPSWTRLQAAIKAIEHMVQIMILGPMGIRDE